MKFFRLILMLPMWLPLSACALSGGPLSGQVLEEGALKPIPGAIVVATWKVNAGFIDSRTVCVYVESGVADQEGKYKLPRWSKPSTVGPLVSNPEPVVVAYKAGYGLPTTPSQKEENVYLAPFRGTNKDRLNYLWSAGVQCGSAGEARKNLVPLYKSLYEEAKRLPTTKEERDIVDAMLYQLENIELGHDAALNRMLERQKGHQ